MRLYLCMYVFAAISYILGLYYYRVTLLLEYFYSKKNTNQRKIQLETLFPPEDRFVRDF